MKYIYIYREREKWSSVDRLLLNQVGQFLLPLTHCKKLIKFVIEQISFYAAFFNNFYYTIRGAGPNVIKLFTPVIY
jgi:hypothetical protein